MKVKFGDKIQLKVTPHLILELSDYLEKWLTELTEEGRGEIDAERECTAKAQCIVSFLARQAGIKVEEEI